MIRARFRRRLARLGLFLGMAAGFVAALSIAIFNAAFSDGSVADRLFDDVFWQTLAALPGAGVGGYLYGSLLATKDGLIPTVLGAIVYALFAPVVSGAFLGSCMGPGGCIGGAWLGLTAVGPGGFPFAFPIAIGVGLILRRARRRMAARSNS